MSTYIIDLYQDGDTIVNGNRGDLIEWYPLL